MTTKTYSLYDGKYTIVYEEGPQIKEILRYNTLLGRLYMI